MGCCDSKSSVPEIIIPDPEPGQKCAVLFKKTGMLSKDQNVFQDMDKTKKWLLLDKEGGFWSNPTYVLENFVRDENGKGEVLCSAKLEVTEAVTYGFKTHVDSDSSDDDSTDDEGEEMRIVKKMKWAQAIKVKFYSDRDMTQKIAEIKVKAKGKAKKTVTYNVRMVDETDAEGNKTGEHEERTQKTDVEKKVKKVKYVIQEMKGEDDCPKINLAGKPDKNNYMLKWEGEVFNAEIDTNGWGSDQIEVKTDYKNPALGMLMGYIVAKEISPDDIKDRVAVF